MMEIIRGDTVNMSITITDDNSNPVDITNATVYFTVKKSITDSDNNAVIKKVITNHVDPVNGKTKVVLSSTETDALTPGKYVYDFSIKFSDGTVNSSRVDTLFVLQDVTREV